MKKIFLAVTVLFFLSISAYATPPSGGGGSGSGGLSPIGEIYCGGAQTSVLRNGRPLSGSSSLETYSRIFLLPEPGLLPLFLALFLISKKTKRS
ncbi:hypothetical protein IKW72_01580 [bacterium]|nr:hypothetical protein [bacterium]